MEKGENMNFKLVFRVLGQLLLCEAALLLPSLGVSILYREGDALAFFLTIVLTALCGGLLAALLRPKNKDMSAKDGMAVAGLGWLVLSLFGCLPFLFSGAIPFFPDAFFETVSGFTTTGSTILSKIEGLPHGVLFWRCFTHWIGGMGVLVLTVAVLPRLSGRTAFIARAESPGPTFSKLMPRMSDSAKALYLLYILLTAAQTVCLRLAGMDFFDALTHSFSTAGTGGFSNYAASVAAFQSPAIEWIIAVFMMLYGVNFACYFHLVRREWGVAVRSEELRTYLSITVLSTLAIAVSLLPQHPDFMEALRLSYFQTTSIMSTTGYCTADFNLWPHFARALLVLLMCVGGCAGSTAGGFKMSRLVLLAKTAYRELRHSVQPRKVSVIRFEGKVVQEPVVFQILVFLFLYVALVLLGALALSLEGIDFTSAFTASLTCVSNVGPGLNAVGPVENFAFFSAPAKFFLSFLMLAGRLEILPILLLLCPSFWRKN
mgnify:FL=1